MGKREKLIAKILSGDSDANIAFTDLRNLLSNLGFAERIRGDHYIFTKTGVEEILNLQPKGSKAKAYQVKQVRDVIRKYGLGGQNGASL
jgi:virulence-associated protein VapD